MGSKKIKGGDTDQNIGQKKGNLARTNKINGTAKKKRYYSQTKREGMHKWLKLQRKGGKSFSARRRIAVDYRDDRIAERKQSSRTFVLDKNGHTDTTKKKGGSTYNSSADG